MELVASHNRWVYFRKKVVDGDFDIYSDIDSKIKHYKRVRVFFLVVIAINLIAGLMNYVWGNVANIYRGTSY